MVPQKSAHATKVPVPILADEGDQAGVAATYVIYDSETGVPPYPQAKQRLRRASLSRDTSDEEAHQPPRPVLYRRRARIP